jgi:hypothetical protein
MRQNKTDFTDDYKLHTDKGHRLARKEIYPMFFKEINKIIDTQLDQDDLAGQILDAEFAVDRLIITPDRTWSVQERCRLPKWYYIRDYKDEISINAINRNSNHKSEWYKLQLGCCDWFLYTFYDSVLDKFLKWVFIDGQDLGRALKNNQIKYSNNNNNPNFKNQLVHYVKLSELDRHNITYVSYDIVIEGE